MRFIARIFALGVGSIFAGLFFGIRELAPYLQARRTGVIRRRGYSALLVRRDEEPDRFAALVRKRLTGALLGFGLSIAGLVAVVVTGAVMFVR
jgi:hypothetical protein